MAGVCGGATALTSWPGSKREKEGGSGSHHPFKSMLPEAQNPILMLECLPSKHEALTSHPVPPKNQKSDKILYWVYCLEVSPHPGSASLWTKPPTNEPLGTSKISTTVCRMQPAYLLPQWLFQTMPHTETDLSIPFLPPGMLAKRKILIGLS
jgi:hypothetical protein